MCISVCQDWCGFTRHRKEIMCKTISPQTFLALSCCLIQHYLTLPAGNSSHQNVCNWESCWCWARNWRCSGAQESALWHRGERIRAFFLSHTLKEHKPTLVSINQHDDDDDAHVFLCQGKGKQLPGVQGSGRLRRNLCHCNMLPVVSQWHKSLLCHHWHIPEPIQRGVQGLPMAGTKPQQLQGWECLPLSLSWRTQTGRDSGQCQPSQKISCSSVMLGWISQL